MKLLKINHGIVKAFLCLHRYSSPVGILISRYSHSQIWAQEGPSSLREFSSHVFFDDRP